LKSLIADPPKRRRTGATFSDVDSGIQRETRQLADGWTVVTKDRSLSAQWEHMVAVTEQGCEVLTAWPGGTGVYLVA
jgi:methionine aminopeptidase